MGELKKGVLVFGWLTNGVGVLVLRYKSEPEAPNDSGGTNFTVTMDDSQEYAALFYDDMEAVVELEVAY